jgi:hypothetical protein
VIIIERWPVTISRNVNIIILNTYAQNTIQTIYLQINYLIQLMVIYRLNNVY